MSARSETWPWQATSGPLRRAVTSPSPVPTPAKVYIQLSASTMPSSALLAPRQPSVHLWRTPADPVDRFAGRTWSSRTERARRHLPAPPPAVFSALFSGDWMLGAHAAVGNAGARATAWARRDDGYMTRTLRFSRALGYRFGPKATRVIETQRYSFTSGGGVVVETSGYSLDVPFSESFRVEGFIEVSPAGEGSLVVASVGVHFLKSIMFRGRILSGAMSETEKYYGELLELAEKEIAALRSSGGLLDFEKMEKEANVAKIQLSGMAEMEVRADGGEGVGLPSPKRVRDSPRAKTRRAEMLDREPLSLAETVSENPEVLKESADDEETDGSLESSKMGSSCDEILAVKSDPKTLDISVNCGTTGATWWPEVDVSKLVVVLLAFIVLLLAVCTVILSRIQDELVRLIRLNVEAKQSGAFCCARQGTSVGLE